MQLSALVALSFGMSMDAFAVALGRGAGLARPSLVAALKTGLVFGVIESLTPLLGYVFGVLAEDMVKTWDHWLSFVLLGGLGLHMLYEAFKGDDDTKTKMQEGKARVDIDQKKPTKNAPWILVLTAFATSIDAMIVGVTLAFLQVNIWLACALIGLATIVMVTLGTYLGHKLGEKIGKWAEVFGAMVLMGIGTSILLTHLAG